MKKLAPLFFIFISLVSFADDNLEIRLQILDSEITRLTNQRDEKFTELQKCEKSTTGFKIAGLTTLVATGVGIYGNIKLAEKLDKRSGGNRGGKGANLGISNKTAEQAHEDGCESFCLVDPDVAPENCSC